MRCKELLFSTLFCLSLPVVTFSLPKNGIKTHGELSLSSKGGSLYITSASHKSIIDWDSFSIGKNERVQFTLPSSSSSVLNTISGKDPSQIFGSLSSNGKVILLNPNGILFGKNAEINCAAFLAAAAHLPDNVFLKNDAWLLEKTAQSRIENNGWIKTYNGDLILYADEVINNGTLTAEGGITALLSENKVLIKPQEAPLIIAADAPSTKNSYAPAIKNSGTISSFSTDEVDGHVVLFSADHDLINKGTIVAKNVSIDGNNVTLTSTSKIDIENKALIGSAKSTDFLDIEIGSEINADGKNGINKGNGGSVYLWSRERTRNLGSISARGDSTSGDGGFVEVSSLGVLETTGSVDTTASNGKTGTLLLDPCDIHVGYRRSPTRFSTDGGVYAPTGKTSYVYIPDLIKYNQKSSVVITTTKGKGGKGNIYVSSYLGTDTTNSLTFEADNAIYINGGISANKSDLTLKALDINVGNPRQTRLAKLSTLHGKLTIDAKRHFHVFSGRSRNALVSIKGGAGIDITGGDVQIVGGTGPTCMISLNAGKGDLNLNTTGDLLIYGGSQSSSHVTIGSYGNINLNPGGKCQVHTNTSNVTIGSYKGRLNVKTGNDFEVKTGPTSRNRIYFISNSGPITVEAGRDFIIPGATKGQGAFSLRPQRGGLLLKAGRDFNHQTFSTGSTFLDINTQGNIDVEATRDLILRGYAQYLPVRGNYNFKAGNDIIYDTYATKLIYNDRPISFDAGGTTRFLKNFHHRAPLTLKGNSAMIGDPKEDPKSSITVSTTDTIVVDLKDTLSIIGGKRPKTSAKLLAPQFDKGKIKADKVIVRGGEGRDAFATLQTTSGPVTIEDNSIIKLAEKSQLISQGDLNVFASEKIDLKKGSQIIANNNIQLIAGKDIVLNEESQIVSRSGNDITLIVDNCFPNSPSHGKGSFVMMKGAKILSNPFTSKSGNEETGKVRLFTVTPEFNSIESTINGVPYSPDPERNDSPHEQWEVFYPSTFFGGPGYTFFYKAARHPPVPWTPLQPIIPPKPKPAPITPNILPKSVNPEVACEMLWSLNIERPITQEPADFEIGE